MSLKEFMESIGIEVELIPEGKKNRPKGKNTREKITIHNTDNPRKGADARAHSNFVRNTGYYMHNGKPNWISWHYTVDDTRAIQHVPDEETAWHAGKNGNAKSVAIEICMNQGIDQGAANDRAAKLAAYLLYKHGRGIDDLVTHQHWTDKKCPSQLIGKWSEFKDDVGSYLAILQGKKNANFALDGGGQEFQFEVSEHVEGVPED